MLAKGGRDRQDVRVALRAGAAQHHVNAIAPGAGRRESDDRVIEAQAGVSGVDVERMRESFVETLTAEAHVDGPDDIALRSPRSLGRDHGAHISGQCIPVTAATAS